MGLWGNDERPTAQDDWKLFLEARASEEKTQETRDHELQGARRLFYYSKGD